MTRPLWKILGPARDAIHGGTGVWPEPGEWLEVKGTIWPCVRGLHLCRQQDLIRWVRVGAVVWTVETTGPVVNGDCNVVVGRARLVEPVGRITGRVLRLTAADIAESVAYLHGRDPACMEAIRVARLCAHGLATAGEAEAAQKAAWDTRDAAQKAAQKASWDAAWDTREAAWAAAWDAAWAAAWDAARWDTREAAQKAAWDAARAAAWDAAWAAAWAAAAGAARWDTREAAEEAAREAARVGHGGILLNNITRWGQQ